MQAQKVVGPEGEGGVGPAVVVAEFHFEKLRQRKEEIPLLMHHFMQQLSRRYDLPPRKFTTAVLEACQQYSWPGNLSELERFVKRYLVMPDHEFASSQELFPSGTMDVIPSFSQPPVPVPINGESKEQASVPDSLKSLVQTVRVEAERNAIVAALQKTGWNRKAAARMIKVSYRTLLYKIDQYHLRPNGGAQLPEEHASNGNGNGNGSDYKGNGTIS